MRGRLLFMFASPSAAAAASMPFLQPYEHVNTSCCHSMCYALLCRFTTGQRAGPSCVHEHALMMLVLMQGALVARQGPDGAISPQGWWLRKSIL